MKKREIVNMLRVLGKIRTAGMTDQKVKSALISADLKLYKHGKENDELVARLSERYTPEENDSANEAYDMFLNEEVDVTLDRIDRDDFSHEVGKTETDIYLWELQYLEPLFKED